MPPLRARFSDGGVSRYEPTNEKDWSRLKKISGVYPGYTRVAFNMGVQGEAIVKCRIHTDGAVRHCRMLKSLPYMDEHILQSLHASRYEPARFRGEPLTVEYVFRFKFVWPGGRAAGEVGKELA